ncbi:MAG: DNA polymerase III subunit gamma/tau [Clostridiaceae bacterium]|nr:DNA polymerase III subunit gamma/tau [Clostridiaceae bacterium]
MSYIALYRKWRPMIFEDVVEQEHIVRSLKNSVCNDHIAHAYLFCGTRGTGKTTMAHILARAINCLNPQKGNPCNECEICRGIISGSILDVIEIDAASNNSVDNIREIRDEVVYSPSQAKFKVYIIDEVHMLSTGAFNALLKTLEEPPARVVFILATTEPHKLPATILSRCQRYDFRRITSRSIAKHLNKIALASNVKVEQEALDLIARLSDGALRDALSILDQCISMGSDDIKYEDVLTITGVVNETFVASFAEALNKKDINESLVKVNTLFMEGKDISQFVIELITYYRNLLICNTIDDPSQIIETSDESLRVMKSQAGLLDRSFIISVINELSSLEVSLKWSSQPRIMLEVALIKMCCMNQGKNGNENFLEGSATNSTSGTTITNSQSTSASQSVHSSVASLAEANRPDGNNMVYNNAADNNTDNNNRNNNADNNKSIKDKHINDSSKSAKINTTENDAENNTESVYDQVDAKGETQFHEVYNNLNEIWTEVLQELSSCGKRPLCICLSKARVVKLNKNAVGIIFPQQGKVNKDIASQADNLQLIEKAFKTVTKEDIQVRCMIEKDGDDYNSHEQVLNESDDVANKIIDFADKFNIPINVIDG